MKDWLCRSFAYFGLAGSLQLSACISLAALVYHGRRGQPYSLLNHFISELGEVGVSRLAWLFNGGMLLAGLLFLFFCIGLGLALDNGWARLGLLAGSVASLSCSAVGLFPMNNLDPHITAAMTYFRFGLLTVLLFAIAIWRQPPGSRVISPWANLASLLAAACYAGFLLFTTGSTAGDSSSLDPAHILTRPVVWGMAVLEWSVFFSTVAWFFAIALAAFQHRRSPGPQTSHKPA